LDEGNIWTFVFTFHRNGNKNTDSLKLNRTEPSEDIKKAQSRILSTDFTKNLKTTKSSRP